MQPAIQTISTPLPGDLSQGQLFAAKFPLGVAHLNGENLRLERPQAPPTREPCMGPYSLTDASGQQWQGVPQHKHPGGADCQHFALLKRRGRTIAVPIEWKYVFKRDRRAAALESLDAVEQALASQQRQAGKTEDKLRDRYYLDVKGFKTEADRPESTSRTPKRTGPDADVDELFELDHADANDDIGWDFAEELANEDVDVEPSAAVAREAAEEELAVLQAEGDELARKLRSEGRSAGVALDPALRADWGDEGVEEEDEAAAKETQARKRITRLRRELKKLDTIQGSPMVSSDDESEEEEEEDGSAPSTGRPTPLVQSPVQPPLPSPPRRAPAQPTAFVSWPSAPTAAPAAAKRPAQVSSPEQVQSKRPRTTQSPQLSLSVGGSRGSSPRGSTAGGVVSVADMDPGTYRAIMSHTQLLWPRTDTGQYSTQLRLKQALDVVTQAVKAIVPGSVGNQLIKQIFQTANKGAEGKPKFLKIVARGEDGKSLFNILVNT